MTLEFYRAVKDPCLPSVGNDSSHMLRRNQRRFFGAVVVYSPCCRGVVNGEGELPQSSSETHDKEVPNEDSPKEVTKIPTSPLTISVPSYKFLER